MNRRQWAAGIVFLLVIGLAGCGAPAAAPADESSTAPAADQPAASGEQAAAATGLAELPKNADGYTDISVDQLATALENKDFTLVNTHIPYEGELPNTDLFLAYDTINDHLGELPAKDAPIVLYCRSGNMSTTAAKDLVAQGYTNVYELDGGFNAWKAAGKELLMQQ